MSARTTAGLSELRMNCELPYPLRGLSVRFVRFLYTVLAPIAHSAIRGQFIVASLMSPDVLTDVGALFVCGYPLARQRAYPNCG